MLEKPDKYANESISLPEEIIFFVTSRCNLRCRHCFNWKNLNRSDDLPLTTIENLARSLPRLRNLSLSGGEPFLRKDLVEICQSFFNHCQLRHLEIPTNGTVPDKIVRRVEQILGLPSRPHVSISVSLDGLTSFHDTTRGMPGSFVKAIDCCKQLLDLKTRHSCMDVNILTTVTRHNVDELISLAGFVKKELPAIDNFYWGLLRGDLMHGSPDVPTVEQVECLDRMFLKLGITGRPRGRVRFETRLYELRRNALKYKKQPVPCVAGSVIGVVYDNGDVAPCEMLSPVGNIRENSLPRIWHGLPMRRTLKMIRAGECSCTHECFLYPSYVSYLNRSLFSAWRIHGFRVFVPLFRGHLRHCGEWGCRLDNILGLLIDTSRGLRQSLKR